MKRRMGMHHFITGIMLVYLLLPLLATLLFALASKWSVTLLPESFTLRWFAELFQDKRFFLAMGRTVLIIVLSVALGIAVMVPTVFIVSVYFPRSERFLQAVAMLPFGIPPVVAAVGLLRMYAGGPLPLAGTPWILIFTYFVATLPFMYQGIRNSLRTVNAIELVHAAELLGANKWTAFRKVVLPGIAPGILVAVLLSVAMLFGEFALANLLVGGRFETLQIYLYQKINKSGHLGSAIVVTYYLLIVLITWALLKTGKSGHLSRR
jgi:putative spermidine/putrescine transport system permease protein